MYIVSIKLDEAKNLVSIDVRHSTLGMCKLTHRLHSNELCGDALVHKCVAEMIDDLADPDFNPWQRDYFEQGKALLSAYSRWRYHYAKRRCGF